MKRNYIFVTMMAMASFCLHVTELKAGAQPNIMVILCDDLGESSDLSQTHPEKLAELMQRLETHYRALVDDSYVWEVKP
jgi:hypothetical protein